MYGKYLIFICLFIFGQGIHSQNVFINEYNLQGFTVKYEGVETPYNIASLFSLPQKKVKFSINKKEEDKNFIFFTSSGSSYPIGTDSWIWELPDSVGHYTLNIIETGSNEVFHLNCFVVFPYEEVKGSSLNAFQIGHYPASENEIYRTPEGFIEVTPEMLELQLSPNFKVRDFLCKQKCEFPMYLVLKEKLLLKLELIFESLLKEGYDVQNIAIMSGYRTPYYNESIGNVTFSRHQFGDAADIYVDNDNDNYMDDLNKDGKRDDKDVEAMYEVVLKMTKKDWFLPYVGGLGFYKSNAVRTGFIHVDVRGQPARW